MDNQQINYNYNCDEVKHVIFVKEIMERIPVDDQSMEYKQIVQLIEEYLSLKCQHSLVLDTIDVTTEKSLPIMYCKWCFTTFNT